jgi:glutamyl-Q tRNA(Asp) synthetase
MAEPTLRFAPSPNGPLHLGHAHSALFGARAAAELRGRYLLRMEDIDVLRCRPEFIVAAQEILEWLGLRFDGPVRQQSKHMEDYARVMDGLKAQGLLYPCWCTRSQLADEALRDPDGAPLHRGPCREGVGPYALRLNMEKAMVRGLSFIEQSDGSHVEVEPRLWGDVVIARKDIGVSYHLCVVVDDGLQGVTHVTRGRDLFMATHLHRLLQHWLGLPEPIYHHHELITDAAGRKLSKSEGDPSLAALREQGMSAQKIRDVLGF